MCACVRVCVCGCRIIPATHTVDPERTHAWRKIYTRLRYLTDARLFVCPPPPRGGGRRLSQLTFHTLTLVLSAQCGPVQRGAV